MSIPEISIAIRELGALFAGGISIVPGQTAIIADVKAAGVNSGTFTAGAWVTHDMNTIVQPQEWLSLANNQLTLDLGTYYIFAATQGRQVNRHNCRLYNVTAQVELVRGMASYATDDFPVPTLSLLIGRFSVNVGDALELQAVCEVTKSLAGFGVTVDGSLYDHTDTQLAIAVISRG